MGWLTLVLALVPSIVKGIQSVVGDAQSGATKKQMAHDALNAAIQGASVALTGQNANYAQLAGEVASVAIDQTVAIAKAQGAYQKWTAIANAASADLPAATQTVAEVHSQLVPSEPVTPAPAATTQAPTANVQATLFTPPAEAPGVAH